MYKSIIKKLKFGHIPGLGADLFSEIKFAQKHFDFIEITLNYNSTEYSQKYLERLKQQLGDFEVLGHIHWKIDLTTKEGLKSALENVKIYKLLGAKKITIHPFINQNINQKQVRSANLKALKNIVGFCRKHKIQLLVENISNPPFNLAKELAFLLRNNPHLLVTLDIGHANKVSEREIKNFLRFFPTKIKHIHLHYNKNGNDHLFFPKTKRSYLKHILKKINELNIDPTVTLEMFAVLEKQKVIQLGRKRRRELLLSQLNSIKRLV